MAGIPVWQWDGTEWKPTISAGVAAYVNPTIKTFTSGSGTYIPPVGLAFFRVRLVGGATGGAGGSTSGNGGNSSAAGNTTFGALTAGGGGATNAANNIPGIGGSASGGNILNIAGAPGDTGTTPASGSNGTGGSGGNSVFGGGGAGGSGGAGTAAATNSGSGGGGGGCTNVATSGYGGPGGGAGGYVEHIYTSPFAASYAWAVGTGTAGGAAGTNGGAGAAGASGQIVVEEYYGVASTGSGLDGGAVRFDSAQSLTTAQQNQAKSNIAVGVGVSTGTAAAAGQIGEVISSGATTGSLSSGVPTTVTSITLTPGDWDLSCIIDFNTAGATTVTDWFSSISTTPNTISAALPGTLILHERVAATNDHSNSQCHPPTQVLPTANTTYYVNVQSVFTNTAPSATAILRARRMH